MNIEAIDAYCRENIEGFDIISSAKTTDGGNYSVEFVAKDCRGLDYSALIILHKSALKKYKPKKNKVTADEVFDEYIKNSPPYCILDPALVTDVINYILCNYKVKR